MVSIHPSRLPRIQPFSFLFPNFHPVQPSAPAAELYAEVGKSGKTQLKGIFSFIPTGGAVVKNLPANAGDARDSSSIPGLGRSPGVGNGNPLLHSCLEILWTEEPGKLQVYEVTKNGTQLSD